MVYTPQFIGLLTPKEEATCTNKSVHRVFDAHVAPEPAYPSLVPSIAETAYYEDVDSKRGDPRHTSEDVRENSENLKILHAPPG